jgi:hypothetical protein
MQYSPRVSSARRQSVICVLGVPPVRSTAYTMHDAIRAASVVCSPSERLLCRWYDTFRKTEYTMDGVLAASVAARRQNVICMLGVAPVRCTAYAMHHAIRAVRVVCSPSEHLLCDWYDTSRITEYTMECSQ